jgi:hypothetical protein
MIPKSTDITAIVTVSLMIMALLGLKGITSVANAQEARQSATLPVAEDSWMNWPSQPPKDCPFPASKTLAGIRFTGRHAEYANADTWYPSWASDGNLYSPYS